MLLLNTDHLHWGHFHGYHNDCIYELYVTERCYVGVMSVVARLHKHDLVKRPTTDEPCLKWIY